MRFSRCGTSSRWRRSDLEPPPRLAWRCPVCKQLDRGENVISPLGMKMVKRPGKLKSFRADIKRWGFLRSLFGRVTLLLREFAGLNVEWVLVRDLVRPLAESHRPDGIAVRVARAEELLKAAGDRELDMDCEFVHGALARGDLALGAFDGDSLVCC